MKFYSPLRYPGGKNKLAKFIASICVQNNINGHYVEPYAGGASVALHLLINGYVKEITINDFDKRAIGKPNLPTTTLGWTIGGSWKGFSISVLFQGSFDYSFAINGTGIESGKSQFQPLHQKRWTQERYENGESIEFPRLTMQDGTINSASAYNSDFWLINAWYIRLKTVDLGYQLPKTALPKFLDNVRFYVNAYNLLTFTGYDKYQQDPEIKTNTAGDAYMNQRVINFGVQLGF